MELPATVKRLVAANLPRGKSLQDVYSDFIRYLFDSAKSFIQESEPFGKELWATVEHNTNLILSHPRRWGDREFVFLRKAVVCASVFTEEEALTRVSFVTEEEAIFNFCVAHTTLGELLKVWRCFLNSGIYIHTTRSKPRHKVVVIDAGDATTDISAYIVKSTSPLEVEEFMEPQCRRPPDI